MHFISVVTARFDVLFKSLNVTKTINIFLAHRRGFTIRLKKLKPRAPDFGGTKILGVWAISSVSVSNYIFVVLVWFNARFFATPLKIPMDKKNECRGLK